MFFYLLIIDFKIIKIYLFIFCKQDDAVSSYDADINQMTVGHGFIYEEFGVPGDYYLPPAPFL